MKTLRLIGMALFAVLMCVNFASCSSSNDDPTEEKEEEIVNKAKRLTAIKQTYSSGENYYALFSYDEKNRLVNLKTGYDKKEWSTDLTWGNNIVMFKSNTYHIKNGYVIEEDRFNYSYDSSNQFISKTKKDKNESSKNGVIYIWDKGNLVKNEYYKENKLEVYKQISYNDKTFKGHFPLMSSILFYDIDGNTLYYEDFGLFIAHPELLGKITKNLPNKITHSQGDVYSLDYTFTNDGYIESCTVVEETSSKKDTMIVTFKWE